MNMWVGHLCPCVCVCVCAVWFLHKNWLEIYKLNFFTAFFGFCFVARSESQIKIKLFAIVVVAVPFCICTWKGRHMCTTYVCVCVCVAIDFWILPTICWITRGNLKRAKRKSGKTKKNFPTNFDENKIILLYSRLVYSACRAGLCHAQDSLCQIGN